MLGPTLDIQGWVLLCWVLLTFMAQLLCISVPETLLDVTLKRQSGILDDIFARLLRYFRLSCKNLTVTHEICLAMLQVN